MAILQKSFDEFWLYKKGEEYNAYMERVEAKFSELRVTARNLPDGEVVGALLKFPVGDGYAHYRVVKEKPLTLEHIPLGDAWQIPLPHIRGITKQDVLKQQQRLKSPLFGTFT